TYNGPGPFTITTTINHEASTAQSVTSTATSIAVTLTPPTNQTASEGASSSFSLGSFADANNGPWTATIAWGDGTPNTTFTPTTKGALSNQSHTYGEEGSYTVTITVKDTGSNQMGSATFSVSVADPAVVAAAVSFSAI